MPFKRWYDEIEELSYMMTRLEHVSHDTQNEIADDVIQLILDRQYEFDEFLMEINSMISQKRDRWYDKNENLLTAVKMIKYLYLHSDMNFLKEIISTVVDRTDKENK